MAEREFECRPDTTIRAETERIQSWIEAVTCESRKPARVTVRVEPMPERVKWPWPDVSRVKIGPLEGYPSKARQVLIWGGSHWIPWFVDREHVLDSFGTWPANESRIAENDNGFVKLSEVPDAK